MLAVRWILLTTGCVGVRQQPCSPEPSARRTADFWDALHGPLPLETRSLEHKRLTRVRDQGVSGSRSRTLVTPPLAVEADPLRETVCRLFARPG